MTEKTKWMKTLGECNNKSFISPTIKDFSIAMLTLLAKTFLTKTVSKIRLFEIFEHLKCLQYSIKRSSSYKALGFLYDRFHSENSS